MWAELEVPVTLIVKKKYGTALYIHTYRLGYKSMKNDETVYSYIANMVMNIESQMKA